MSFKKKQKHHKSPPKRLHHIKEPHLKSNSQNEFDECDELYLNLSKTEDLTSESELNLPSLAADYVSNVIELIDMARLPSAVQLEFVISILDELYRISLVFPKIDENDLSTIEINEWRKKLMVRKEGNFLKYFNKKLHTTMKKLDCRKMEFDANRWLANFKFQLKSLQ